MNFIGLNTALELRVAEALAFLKVNHVLDNIEVSVLDEEASDCIEIGRGASCYIRYKEKHHFFRALGLYIQLSKGFTLDFERAEKEVIKKCGPMIDCSRNAVYKVSVLKELLLKCAMMGHSECMLYTEDTYEVDDTPYFGYLRGKYLKSELKELDDYADSLGIELIPCIQTLAHLNQTLRWDYTKEIRDIDDIFLVGAKETYDLVEKMLGSLRSVFRTKRIHIGMDEAYALGRGTYLDHNGYKSHFDIMIQHLKSMVDLTKKYDFKPMIWDDMFQRAPGEGYNTQMMIDPKITEQVPDEIELVYWDYYKEDTAHYDVAFKRRQSFENPIIFAGGIWKWAGLVPSYEKTMATTLAALKVCKQHGIQEVIATLWGDDGAEVPLGTCDLGLILFAEHSYSSEVSEKWLDERCQFFTGLESGDFMAMENVDLLPMIERPNVKVVNLSKAFLYQDILLGAFDKHAEGLELKPHYLACAKMYDKLAEKGKAYGYIFEMYRELSLVLANKYDLGIRLRTAYLVGDKEELQNLLTTTFKEVSRDLEKYHQSVRKFWFKECKGQGLEILDIRISGVKGRMETAAIRVQAYIDGEIEEIEELADDRLLFDRHGGAQFCNHNQYVLIASQNVFSHNYMQL
ncbi:MAG: beta-N-acetylhexosaminidase [Cellulosilyticaceae bacterium]